MRQRLVSRSAIAVLTVCVLAAAPLGCSKSSGAPAGAAAEAPPAAPAFDGWVIQTNDVVPRAQIDEIESRLGGKIKALRNVTYQVNGRKIQVNVIAARDATEADKLHRGLLKTKASWSVVRKGEVVYELVGPNESMEDMKKARDDLNTQ